MPEPSEDWEALYWECRHYWRGCPEFDRENFGALPVPYIMQAIQHGKRLHFRDLHHESIVPARVYAAQVGGMTQEEAFPWLKLAYPSESEFTPEAIAAVKHLIGQPFYPRWVNSILPMDRIVDLIGAKEVPSPLAFYSRFFLGFAPKVLNDRYVYFPLAVFDIPAGKDGESFEPIVLHDDNSSPLMSIIVPKYGKGYYTDEKFVIVKRWEASYA